MDGEEGEGGLRAGGREKEAWGDAGGRGIGWGGGRGMGDRGARVFEVPNPMYLTTAGCVCPIHCVETNEQTNDTNV